MSRRATSLAKTLKDPRLLTRSVRDVMSSPVVTMERDMALDAACELMISEGIRRLGS
jgi:CBS domain-containing protein